MRSSGSDYDGASSHSEPAGGDGSQTENRKPVARRRRSRQAGNRTDGTTDGGNGQKCGRNDRCGATHRTNSDVGQATKVGLLETEPIGISVERLQRLIEFVEPRDVMAMLGTERWGSHPSKRAIGEVVAPWCHAGGHWRPTPGAQICGGWTPHALHLTMLCFGKAC